MPWEYFPTGDEDGLPLLRLAVNDKAMVDLDNGISGLMDTMLNIVTTQRKVT
jgi:hypothetical protein